MTRDIAMTYAHVGLKVFPCDRDKSPLTPHGFKDATSDISRFQRAWKLIGLATGEVNNIVVLDFDLHKNGSCLSDFEKEFDLSLDQHPYRVRTMSGGLHFYFRYPNGHDIRSRNGFRPGVDVKANGGYVIAADGKAYRLEGVESGFDPSKTADLPQLPSAVIEALSEKPRTPSVPADIRTEAVVVDGGLRYQINRCLSVISNEEYETWYRVGMILHNIFKASDDGLQLWIQWASSSSKFKEREHAEKWATYDYTKQNAIGIKALKKLTSEAVYGK